MLLHKEMNSKKYFQIWRVNFFQIGLREYHQTFCLILIALRKNRKVIMYEGISKKNK